MTSLSFSRKSFLKIATGLVRNSSTYNAAILEKFNKPLKIEGKKSKTLNNGEARIKVHCCAVNPSDYQLAQGVNPSKYPVPITPGYEMTGVIKEVKDCKTVATGDRVVALSKDKLGGFAEECIVHENDIWCLPSNIPFDEGAALVDSFGTAMLGLSHRSNLCEKQVVLATFAPVHGFGALDIAANVFKAKVIAVCMNDSDTGKLRERGAWSTLAYNEKQMISLVNELTDNQGVHIVYDTLAGDVLKTSLKCVRHEGSIVVAGYTLKELPQVSISHMLSLPSFNIMGVSLVSYRTHDPKMYRQVVSEVIEMMDQGLISPTISAKYPLTDINKALEEIKSKQEIGKIIIEMKT